MAKSQMISGRVELKVLRGQIVSKSVKTIVLDTCPRFSEVCLVAAPNPTKSNRQKATKVRAIERDMHTWFVPL